MTGQPEPLADSVSVVIPTYNRADLLPRAIDSALGQTTAPFEVIVVDDGSTDDTETRCREWGDRIRYMRTANGGVAAARNAGITAARGAWVALLDSDDLWEPGKLEVQLTAMRAAPSAAWCLSGCEIVDGSDRARPGPQSFAGVFPVFREIRRSPEVVFREQLHQFEIRAAGGTHACFHGDLFSLLFFGNVALPSSALIRRQFVQQIGAFDGSLRMAEETEFFHRAAAYSPVVIVMSRLVRYRAAQSDSITAGRNAAALTEVALRSLDAASARRPMRVADRKALEAGRRHLLLRLAYAHLSARDGASTRGVLRRLRGLGLPLGRRGGTLWVASLLPPAALDGMHRGKRLLRRSAGRT